MQQEVRRMRMTLPRTARMAGAIGGAAALAWVALTGGEALATKAKAHRFTEQTRTVLLDGNTGIAEITGGQSGTAGAEIFHFTTDGLTATGTFYEYNRHGSFSGTFTTVATPQSDGGLTTATKKKITEGSGRYAGARGRIAESCTFPPGSSTAACTRDVVIRY
jgi:hypothetical protein